MRKIMNILGIILRIIGMLLIIPVFLLALPGFFLIFTGELIDEESCNDKLAKGIEDELKNRKI